MHVRRTLRMNRRSDSGNLVPLMSLRRNKFELWLNMDGAIHIIICLESKEFILATFRR